ncbi:MAG: hypothetical protein WD768_01735 [Phycisphaeraceae bacterium]
MKTETDSLYLLLDRLARAKIHHVIRHDREGAVSIDVTVPGERWEIDVLEDGSVEVEVFKSDGEIHPQSKLKDLFTRFSD